MSSVILVIDQTESNYVTVESFFTVVEFPYGNFCRV
jgi:hypothetical protein